MRTLALTAIALGALLLPSRADEAKRTRQRTIDLAICLDTSGSMEGLIDAARSKIWTIVNDLALAKPTPRLRVALLAYGGRDYDPEAGYVKVASGFTEDLDLISGKLFSLKAAGSVELVGRVLQRATQLKWQKDPTALKLIVVAGNESADQDKEVPFRDVCRGAIRRGIMINSIYCVRPGEDVAQEWRDIARLSDGHYAEIDQNRTVVLVSPFDEKLAALSTDLNGTYLAFGGRGRKGRAEQTLQDDNARKLKGGVAAQRANAKAGKLYWNSWCLIDATRRGTVKLEDVKEKDLPEVLRGKTLEEMRAYMDNRFKERETIQQKIGELHKQREA